MTHLGGSDMNDDNIVLCGFMGTGKTTAGRALARRLGRRFIDLDDVLEERFGASIHQVLATAGQEAFRRAERQACAQISEFGASIVAVGGGAVVDKSNRDALATFGKLICLDASKAELEKRLAGAGDRPLLQGKGNLRSRIRSLLDERASAYDEVGLHIDTTGRSQASVLDAIVATHRLGLDRVHRLAVNTADGCYDVCVARGGLDLLGQLLTEVVPIATTIAVVTNPMVRSFYGARVTQALESSGYDTVMLEVPDGERYKQLHTVAQLYDALVAAGLDRHATVLALGGGVVGDMAGFAAATYLRGIRFVQVPTTLLAMVDASIGGKTGVDLPTGKNLVGAFKQPTLVLADPEVLQTLSSVQHRCGMAEVIKHTMIDIPSLFDRLRRGPMTLGVAPLARAIRVKVDIVNDDPREQGRRALLNLGHTFAHGFERVSRYRIPHGVAVGAGLRAATRLGINLGRCDATLEQEVVEVLTNHGLFATLEGLPLQAVRCAMSTDKKRVGDRLRFVVPTAVGSVQVVESPDEQAVSDALSAVCR